MAQHGCWWRMDTFESGRSPIKLSLYDAPVENSQLDLMRALPVRDQAGTLIDIQPCLFRNTQDPDILRKEVFPNRPQARKPLQDSWPTSGWEKPQGPNKNHFGKDFFQLAERRSHLQRITPAAQPSTLVAGRPSRTIPTAPEFRPV